MNVIIISFVDITNDMMKTWFDAADIHKMTFDVVVAEVDMIIGQMNLIWWHKFIKIFLWTKMWFNRVPSEFEWSY